MVEMLKEKFLFYFFIDLIQGETRGSFQIRISAAHRVLSPVLLAQREINEEKHHCKSQQ